MVLVMNLNQESFEKIAAGQKTVELRLYDNEHRMLNIGDDIIFKNLSATDCKLAVRVTALYRYASFRDLFEEIPPEKCGADTHLSAEDAANQMNAYYTDDKVHFYGVLGIRMQIIDLNEAEKRKAEEYAAYFERLFPDGMK